MGSAIDRAAKEIGVSVEKPCRLPSPTDLTRWIKAHDGNRCVAYRPACVSRRRTTADSIRSRNRPSAGSSREST